MRSARPCGRTISWRRWQLRTKPYVVVLGDSHAAHWLPAMYELGRIEGWRVTGLTKGSCPPSAVMLSYTKPGVFAQQLRRRVQHIPAVVLGNRRGAQQGHQTVRQSVGHVVGL